MTEAPRKGTPSHVQRQRRSKNRPDAAPSVVHRFKEGPERGVEGAFVVLAKDGRLLSAGDDRKRCEDQSRAFGEGAYVTDNPKPRKRRVA